MSNTSSTGQPENIVMFTSQLRDGSLFYAVAVAPRGELLRIRPRLRPGDQLDPADRLTRQVSDSRADRADSVAVGLAPPASRVP